jgi:hypothetical protein
MNRPHCCPICNDPRVRTTLEPYAVTARVASQERVVNALAAFSCEHGHIFFVRASDLVADPLPSASRQTA